MAPQHRSVVVVAGADDDSPGDDDRRRRDDEEAPSTSTLLPSSRSSGATAAATEASSTSPSSLAAAAPKFVDNRGIVRPRASAASPPSLRPSPPSSSSPRRDSPSRRGGGRGGDGKMWTVATLTWLAVLYVVLFSNGEDGIAEDSGRWSTTTAKKEEGPPSPFRVASVVTEADADRADAERDASAATAAAGGDDAAGNGGSSSSVVVRGGRYGDLLCPLEDPAFSASSLAARSSPNSGASPNAEDENLNLWTRGESARLASESSNAADRIQSATNAEGGPLDGRRIVLVGADEVREEGGGGILMRQAFIAMGCLAPFRERPNRKYVAPWNGNDAGSQETAPEGRVAPLGRFAYGTGERPLGEALYSPLAGGLLEQRLPNGINPHQSLGGGGSIFQGPAAWREACRSGEAFELETRVYNNGEADGEVRSLQLTQHDTVFVTAGTDPSTRGRNWAACLDLLNCVDDATQSGDAELVRYLPRIRYVISPPPPCVKDGESRPDWREEEIEALGGRTSFDGLSVLVGRDIDFGAMANFRTNPNGCSGHWLQPGLPDLLAAAVVESAAEVGTTPIRLPPPPPPPPPQQQQQQQPPPALPKPPAEDAPDGLVPAALLQNFATGPGTVVPAALTDHLADLEDVVDGQGPEHTATPTFWHILKAGGTVFQDLCADCFSLTVASEVGALDGHGEEDTLRIIETDETGLHRYVNVNTAFLPGIQRAGRLGLASSGLADVLFTPELVAASQLIYDPVHRGRMFALFRHPVHRVVSQFYYTRVADWEPTYNPALRDMSLEEFAFSPYVESNWMVRLLVNKMEAPLSVEDLEGAKDVLRIKCLVGLLEKMDESVLRFRQFFGFGIREDGTPIRKVDRCVTNRLSGRKGDGGNRNQHPMPGRRSKAWRELARKNWADVQLYNYAKELFEEQGAVVEREVRRRRRRREGHGASAAGR